MQNIENVWSAEYWNFNIWYDMQNIENICVVYDYAGKADPSKVYWNPKRKLWVTTYF